MYGCGEQEAGVASRSGWNLWVWIVGVVVRRYIYNLYRFFNTAYPYILLLLFFFAAASYFLFILKMFFVLVPVLFGN